MNFNDCFTRLVKHEGGAVNNPADKGGLTNFGISQRSYPGEDIAGLTLERAKAIYLRDFWGPAGCGAMPDGARLQVFDMAVNSGVGAAVKAVQRAVGTTPDGILGPVTLQALQAMPAARFIARFNAQRLILMAGLSSWPAFGRGWVLRVADQLMEA